MQFTVLYPLAGSIVLATALALYGLTLASQRRERLAYAHYHEEVRTILPWSYAWALPLLLLALAAAGLGVQTRTPSIQNCCKPFLAVLDVSVSMNAEDASGGRSRLEAAKEFFDRLIAAASPGTPIGLITFAGNTVLWTSGTLDHAALREEILPLWIPGEFSLSKGGSRLDAAVEHALMVRKRLLEERAAAPLRQRDDGASRMETPVPPEALLIIGDGGTSAVSGEKLLAHARAFEKPIHALGVGGDSPVTIPVYQNGGARRVKDVVRIDGVTALTSLDRAILRGLTEATGGVYADERDSHALDVIRHALRREVSATTTTRATLDLSPLLTAAALVAITTLLVLTAWSMRRKEELERQQ